MESRNEEWGRPSRQRNGINKGLSWKKASSLGK